MVALLEVDGFLCHMARVLFLPSGMVLPEEAAPPVGEVVGVAAEEVADTRLTPPAHSRCPEIYAR